MSIDESVRPALAWSTPGQALALVVRGATFPTAARIALVVGTLLTVINQGGVLLAGDATVATALRVAANFLIPFAVSSTGYLAPFRVRTPVRSA